MTRASAPLSRNHRRAEPGTPHVNDPTAPSPPKSPPNDEESRKFPTPGMTEIGLWGGTPGRVWGSAACFVPHASAA